MLQVLAATLIFSLATVTSLRSLTSSSGTAATQKSARNIESTRAHVTRSSPSKSPETSKYPKTTPMGRVTGNNTTPTRVQMIPRMAGGVEKASDDEEFPSYYVKLFGDEQHEQAYLCGGSFITTHIFVTASNCFDLWDGYYKNLRVDSLNLKGETKPHYTSEIKGVYRYPIHRDENYYVDIALVHVYNPFDSNHLLELPYPGYDDEFIDTYKEVMVVGSGETREVGTTAYPKWIQRGSSGTTFVGRLTLSHKDCEKKVGGFNFQTEICRPLASKSLVTRLCRYDQGAPAVSKKNSDLYYRLIGIYSRSTEKCKDLHTWNWANVDVFTRVSAVVPWILEKVKRYTNDFHDVEKSDREWEGVPFDRQILADTSMDSVRPIV